MKFGNLANRRDFKVILKNGSGGIAGSETVYTKIPNCMPMGVLQQIVEICISRKADETDRNYFNSQLERPRNAIDGDGKLLHFPAETKIECLP